MQIESIKRLVEVLHVLANPVRLKIIALLAERPMYVYELAKMLKLSYPLTHLHLSALEKAGIVESHIEISEESRARRYFRVKDFRLELSPESIRDLMRRCGHR